MPDTAPPQARAPEASHHPVICAGTACPCYQEGRGNQVHQVPPGWVVVLRGDHDPDHLGVLAGELVNAAGHHQFVVVDLPAGTSLDVVHDPQAVADLLGLARPEPPADVAQAYLDTHKGMPHAALLVGDSTTCPCGEAPTAPVHQGTFRVNTEPDLVRRLEASLAAAHAYLAAHPPEPEREAYSPAQVATGGHCVSPGAPPCAKVCCAPQVAD